MDDKQTAIRECCKNPDNLKIIEEREIENGTITVRECQVCERKHYELDANPIPLYAELK